MTGIDNTIKEQDARDKTKNDLKQMNVLLSAVLLLPNWHLDLSLNESFLSRFITAWNPFDVTTSSSPAKGPHSFDNGNRQASYRRAGTYFTLDCTAHRPPPPSFITREKLADFIFQSFTTVLAIDNDEKINDVQFTYIY